MDFPSHETYSSTKWYMLHDNPKLLCILMIDTCPLSISSLNPKFSIQLVSRSEFSRGISLIIIQSSGIPPE